MPTQSLVLRGQIGRKLTIAEMDGNFTYLEELGMCGGSSINLESGFVAIADGSGNATGSNNFTFDQDDKVLSVGTSHYINDSCYSVIVGGYGNTLNGDGVGNYSTSILGGVYNRICYSSGYSSIVGGYENRLEYYSRYSSIIAGRSNCINDSCNSILIGGCTNCLCENSGCSTIIGGADNCIIDSRFSSILNSQCSTINLSLIHI